MPAPVPGCQYVSMHNKLSLSHTRVCEAKPAASPNRVHTECAGPCIYSDHCTCCRGLIIVTAIVSTNTFFQKLSGLVNSLDSAADSSAAVAAGLTKKTSARAQSTESPKSTPERLSKSSAVMRVTLQTDTGKTRISLSSTDALYDPSQGDRKKDERYQGFFDVAAAAVRGAMVGESQVDGPQRSDSNMPRSRFASPLQDEEDPEGGSSSETDDREPRQWIPASEARTSRSTTTDDQGGMLHQLIFSIRS